MCWEATARHKHKIASLFFIVYFFYQHFPARQGQTIAYETFAVALLCSVIDIVHICKPPGADGYGRRFYEQEPFLHWRNV